MKNSILGTLSLLFAAFLVSAGSVAFAGPPTTDPTSIKYIATGSGEQTVITGTSTLHNWTVNGSVIQGDAAFSGDWKPGATPAVALQSIDLAIPVNSLKSTEGGGMDNTMYDAMKFKQFPTISYHLTKATIKSSPSKTDAAYHFDTTGGLTVSGATRQMNLDLRVMPPDNSRITITTEVRLKMSDFGITPPTAMLGMIKSGDAITVKLNWQLADPAPTATARK